MNEESSPTPIRLKPKLKVESDGVAAGPGVEAAPSNAAAGMDMDQGSRLRLRPRAVAAEALPLAPANIGNEGVAPALAESPKVRLKPRLSAEVESAPAVVAEESPITPAPARPVLFADEPVPEAPVETPPVTGFKLKPKLPEQAPAALPEDPEALAALAMAQGAIEPPLPVALELPKLRTKPSSELVQSFDVDASPSRSSKKKSGPFPLVALLIVLLGAGGYFGYSWYGSSANEGGATRAENSASSEAAQSMAGAMVAKTDQVLSERADANSDLADLGIEGRTAEIGAFGSEVMASMPPRPVVAPPEPKISPAFQRFVMEMKISGVFQGEPARAMIDGRTIRQGDMVDPGLGIRFLGLDIDRRLVLLEEPSGAKAAKKY